MHSPYPHRENAVQAHRGALNSAFLHKKRLTRFKQGRISVSKEVRKQQRIRNNYTKSLYRKLSSLLPKHIRTRAKIFSNTGLFSRNAMYRNLENELFAVIKQHYTRIFISTFKDNFELLF